MEQTLITKRVTFDAGNSQYSTNASVSRQYIIDTFDWTISDGGPNYKTKPALDRPADITYMKGSTDNNITWTAGYRNPWIYNVTLGDSVIITDTPWSNGTISINIDGLSVGIHVYEIAVYDTLGNVATDMVNVEVIEETSQPSNTDETSHSSNDTEELEIVLPFDLSFALLAIFSSGLFIILRRKYKRNVFDDT